MIGLACSYDCRRTRKHCEGGGFVELSRMELSADLDARSDSSHLISSHRGSSSSPSLTQQSTPVPTLIIASFTTTQAPPHTASQERWIRSGVERAMGPGGHVPSRFRCNGARLDLYPHFLTVRAPPQFSISRSTLDKVMSSAGVNAVTEQSNTADHLHKVSFGGGGLRRAFMSQISTHLT